jgi:UrcA family protein
VAAAGFAALAALPAGAQTVDEITVVGRLGPDGRPATLSRVVSFADLDLRTEAGVGALRVRIRDTARDLCRQLGETGGGSGLVRSCEDDATADAMNQARPIVAQIRAQPAFAWAPEPAPYVAPTSDVAAAADQSSAPVSATVPEPTLTVTTVTNGPVRDTPENRARFGGPMSNAGQRTAPAGN